MCWKHRELARFADGTYKPVPVALDYPADHFVHLSVTETETETVAYTPSEQYGEADRQVRLKFGRYLRKAFPAFTDAEIQAYVIALKSALALANAPARLQFTTDRETITRIFETPMCACNSTYVSCMHDKFTGEVRPYHVYADSPDVAVAYVTVGDEIRARSVVSTKDKTWVRCYSIQSGDNDADCGTLKAMLKEAGYTSGELYGNRLTKLASSRRKPMLPYIDNGGMEVRSDGGYWVVVEEGEGEYKAELTDGFADECGPRCESCNCLEDDCECSYCECCEERYADGCDTCSFCQHCEGCIEHDGCSCARCSECHELIDEFRHCSHCECDRCGECNELVGECECDKCEECGRLTAECECESDSEMSRVCASSSHASRDQTKAKPHLAISSKAGRLHLQQSK